MKIFMVLTINEQISSARVRLFTFWVLLQENQPLGISGQLIKTNLYIPAVWSGSALVANSYSQETFDVVQTFKSHSMGPKTNI